MSFVLGFSVWIMINSCRPVITVLSHKLKNFKTSFKLCFYMYYGFIHIIHRSQIYKNYMIVSYIEYLAV